MKNSTEVCVEFDFRGRHDASYIDLDQAMETVAQR